jgi:hypothetical protein
MTNTASFQLCGDGDEGHPEAVADGQPLRWPTGPGATDTVESDIGWHGRPLPACPDSALDLLRVAGAAYLADRLTRRGRRFSREINLTVAMRDPDAWTADLSDTACDLLRWLTGDDWTLTPIPDTAPRQDGADAGRELPVGDIALLSGGLDSYLGALHLLDPNTHSETSIRFLGHLDAANAVRAAQTAVGHLLSASFTPPPSYTRYAFRQAGKPVERSSRSRSLLFMAMGIAAVSATGGQRLRVPENGYTSLNLPLHPNRGGALSTRSTHPVTFSRINGVVAGLGLAVTVDNPFADRTKGEAMRAVAAATPPAGWLATAALTMSCSKLDGARLRAGGGNANLHCGLCVPCLVRRATFIAANQPDATRYLVTELSGAAQDELISRRQDDIDAVRYATARPLDDALIDSGTWPPHYDLDKAAAIAQRGLDELAAVPLP